MDDPYLWVDGSCLANLLGIRDPADLEQAEYAVAAVRIAELALSPLPGLYDAAHLYGFHRRIFGDVYAWAGSARTVDISRAGSRFCRWPFIAEQVDALCARIASRDRLVGLREYAFVTELAGLYGELNAIHPFREGNGRTQRAFLGQLAAAAGWRVRWAGLDQAANDAACRHYFVKADVEVLHDLLAPVVEPA